MCTLVILRQSGTDWPVVLAANRDEMKDRPWDAPAEHWPDRPGVVAGRDRLAGGSWLGVNGDGLAAAVLNRIGTLGPADGKRSRGELVLEALDHATAATAARALEQLNPDAYRPFNLVIADVEEVYWLRLADGRLERREVPEGLSMLTAHDLNDTAKSPRTRLNLPLFARAPSPEPVTREWAAWETLLANRLRGDPDEPTSSMTVETESGFCTVSSSLIALPDTRKPELRAARPIWRFAPGPPDRTAFEDISLG